LLLQFIEIEEVKLNMDCSHVTAYWTSYVLQKFAEYCKDKSDSKSYAEFKAKSVDHITQRLQSMEPKFRNDLARNIHFRRIPRIFFKPYDPSFGEYDEELQFRNHHKQEILRQVGPTNHSSQVDE
jgi:ribosome-binding factor A